MASLPIQSVENALAVVRATTPQYAKGESDLTLRNRGMFSLMNKYKTVKFNENFTGVGTVWNVKYKNVPISPYINRGPLNFPLRNLREQLTAQKKRFIAAASISTIEIEDNGKSEQQIIDLFGVQIEDIAQGCSNGFQKLIFNDSAVTTDYFDGFETIFNTGTTVVTDKVFKPAGTYAGKSQALGVEGSWGTDGEIFNASVATAWPFGTGQPEYDWMAPLQLNVNASWTSGTEWEDNCEEVLSFMLRAQNHRCGGMKGSNVPWVALLSASYYHKFDMFFRARNRQMVPVADAIELGMPATLNFNGSWVTEDYNVASDTGYFTCPEMLEYATPFSNGEGATGLFQTFGPQLDPTGTQYLMHSSASGNFRWHPKFHGKFMNFPE